MSEAQRTDQFTSKCQQQPSATFTRFAVLTAYLVVLLLYSDCLFVFVPGHLFSIATGTNLIE